MNTSLLLDPIQCQSSWNSLVFHVQVLHCPLPFPKAYQRKEPAFNPISRLWRGRIEHHNVRVPGSLLQQTKAMITLLLPTLACWSSSDARSSLESQSGNSPQAPNGQSTTHGIFFFPSDWKDELRPSPLFLSFSASRDMGKVDKFFFTPAYPFITQRFPKFKLAAPKTVLTGHKLNQICKSLL